jgi:hypothetical protein
MVTNIIAKTLPMEKNEHCMKLMGISHHYKESCP